MFSKSEIVKGLVIVGAMAVLVNGIFSDDRSQKNSVSDSDSKIVVVEQSHDVAEARTKALLEAADIKGNLKSMVIDDTKTGEGAEAKVGDQVSVHYVGTLQNGEEFDSSKKRGVPFEFSLGAGQVIKGWDEGVVGMKVGGQRVLVIPPDMAYGDQGIGPIPGGATLVFAIELLAIK